MSQFTCLTTTTILLRAAAAFCRKITTLHQTWSVFLVLDEKPHDICASVETISTWCSNHSSQLPPLYDDENRRRPFFRMSRFILKIPNCTYLMLWYFIAIIDVIAKSLLNPEERLPSMIHSVSQIARKTASFLCNCFINSSVISSHFPYYCCCLNNDDAKPIHIKITLESNKQRYTSLFHQQVN